MKKYIMPLTDIVRMNMQHQLLTGSDPQVTIDPTEPAIEPGNVDSRRRRKNQWEDDEDDEMQDDMQF